MEHAQILDFFKPLPKVLRQKIQKFHKSTIPKVVCAECRDLLYPFQVSTKMCMWNYDSICKICEKWGFTENGYVADSD